jgi:hypothetical protein
MLHSKTSLNLKNCLRIPIGISKKINWIFLLLFVLSLILAKFVGGLGLACLLGSVLVTASILSRNSEYLFTRSSLPLSYLLHIVWLTFYFTFGISFAREKMTFLFHEYIDVTAFHPLLLGNQGLEISRLGGLIAISMPSLLLLIRLVSTSNNKSKPINKRKWGDGSFAAFATLIPYLYIAAIKFQDPWRALAFVMSGDGRNHLQYVEQIRSTSHTTLGIKNIGVPVLGNAIGALVSAVNGASGLLDVRDIWGVHSVYVLCAGIFTGIASLFLTTYFKEKKLNHYLYLIVPIILLSIFTSSSGFIVFPILYDGFFSLYFGMAVLALAICFCFTVLNTLKWVNFFILVLVTWSLFASYSFLAPAGFTLAAFYAFLIWRKIPSLKLKIVLVIASTTATSITTFLLQEQFLNEFKSRAQMVGSVYPTDAVFLFAIFLLAVTVIAVTTGELRMLFVAVVLIIGITSLLLEFSESLPGNSAASYSYYSSKLIISTTGALFVLVPLLISLIFKTSLWTDLFMARNSLKKFLSIAAVSAVSLVVIHPLNTNLPIYVIRRGWVNPDPGSIQQVINDWDSGPKLYFQYAQDVEKYDYPSAAADRMLNFWSPLFWDASGEYSQFHTWAYVGQTSSDPAILCDIIKSKQIVVVTRNKDMPNLVENSCGPTETKFKIYK